MRYWLSFLLAMGLAGLARGQSWPRKTPPLEDPTTFYTENFDRIRCLLYWHAGLRLGPQELTQEVQASPSSILPSVDANSTPARVLAVCQLLLDNDGARNPLPPWAPLAEDAWLEGVLRDFDRTTAEAIQQQADLESHALQEADPTGLVIDPFDIASGNALARSGKRRRLLQEVQDQAGPRTLARATRWAAYYKNTDTDFAADPGGLIYWLGQAAGESQFPRYRVAGADIDARALRPVITDTWPPRQCKLASPTARMFLGTSRPVAIDAQALELTAMIQPASPQPQSFTADYDAQRGGIMVTPAGPLPHDAAVTLRLKAEAIHDAETHLPLDADGDAHSETGEAFVLTWRTAARNTPAEPPQFTPPPKHLTSVRARSVMVFSVDATDPQGLPISYEVIGLPKGAQFDPHIRVFYWQPELEHVGQYGVTFQADNGMAKQTLAVTLSVLPDPTVPYAPTPKTQPSDEQAPPPPKPTEEKLFD